jgi:hypothetical protein
MRCGGVLTSPTPFMSCFVEPTALRPTRRDAEALRRRTKLPSALRIFLCAVTWEWVDRDGMEWDGMG